MIKFFSGLALGCIAFPIAFTGLGGELVSYSQDGFEKTTFGVNEKYEKFVYTEYGVRMASIRCTTEGRLSLYGIELEGVRMSIPLEDAFHCDHDNHDRML